MINAVYLTFCPILHQVLPVFALEKAKIVAKILEIFDFRTDKALS